MPKAVNSSARRGLVNPLERGVTWQVAAEKAGKPLYWAESGLGATSDVFIPRKQSALRLRCLCAPAPGPAGGRGGVGGGGGGGGLPPR